MVEALEDTKQVQLPGSTVPETLENNKWPLSTNSTLLITLTKKSSFDEVEFALAYPQNDSTDQSFNEASFRVFYRNQQENNEEVLIEKVSKGSPCEIIYISYSVNNLHKNVYFFLYKPVMARKCV